MIMVNNNANTNNKSVESTISDAQNYLSPDTEAIFYQLYKPDEFLYASGGNNYRGATFGRDSEITALTLLHSKPQVAYDVILRLASLQGTKQRNISGEEAGHIHHESRSFKTKKIGQTVASMVYGGDAEQMTTYFSSDSTPLFTILVAEYAKENPDILGEKVVRNDGKEITIRQSTIEATNWVFNHIAESGLVEVEHHNIISPMHQTWKDSPTGYVKEDGTMLNITKPIAYLNIQALSADSLSASAQLFSETNPEQSKKWQAAADSITENTIDKFWMEDKHFFASAIDKNRHGKERQIKTIQSDAAWILNTDIFKRLPEDKQEKYISAIIKETFLNLLTDVGIRCRPVNPEIDPKVAEYHSSSTVWPVDTYQAAEGCRRYGFPRLAQELDNRLLNAVNASGDHSELYYVQPDGSAVLFPDKFHDKKPGFKELSVQMNPDKNTTWTVAATLAIKDRVKNGDELISNQNKDSWQYKLENEIIASIKHAPIAEGTIIENKEIFIKQESILRGFGRIALRQCLKDAKKYIK